MGSDRKSKEKSRKRSPSSSPSPDEGRHRKRHRRKQEEEDGERRRRRKEKKEHKSKSKDKHKEKHHKPHPLMKIQELTSDDYFSKNNEFATWLNEEKKVFFSDLSSESARAMFSDFVKDWNKQKLDSRYYEGISSGPRSAHSWAIKK